MALSAEEIRTLNEIARRMAEEDPELVRRLMPEGDHRSESDPEEGQGGSEEGEGVRRIEVVEFHAQTRLARCLSSLRAVAPVALVGALLVSGVVVSFLVAAQNADRAGSRSRGAGGRRRS
jgi:hypothetical protein